MIAANAGWLAAAWLLWPALAIGAVVAVEAPSRAVKAVKLPEPQRDGMVSLEEALRQRRSIRSFAEVPLTLQEAGQIAWAAQGITSRDGKRTAPSAGALYPLELYLVAGGVRGLPAGVYRYRPAGHELVAVSAGDRRAALAAATHGQEWLGEAPVILVIAADYERTTSKYGPRGERYVHMEVGHAAQNVYLQAVSLHLGTVAVGAFDDARVARAVGLPAGERPLCLMPVGKAR